MNASFPIRIKDSDQVLSALDLQQIENIVWFQLCPHDEKVVSVKFEVTVLEDNAEDSIVKVTCKTELQSGWIVETISVAGTKVDAIVALGKKLWKDVNSRVRFEQTGFYRCLSASSDQLKRIGSAFWRSPNSVRWSRRQAS